MPVIQKRQLFIILILMITVALSAAEQSSLNLMPVPAEYRITEGKFRLNADFSIGVEGPGTPRTFTAASRTLRRLSDRTGLFFFQAFVTADNPPEKPLMLVKVDRPGELVLGEHESYRLTVMEGQVLLQAETDFGVLRGLETLLQLLSVDDDGYYLPGIRIYDYPRFPWRGLLIDVSRHFEPVEVIKHNLDGMAAVKLNVFHWHLVDDQGFRVECKTFPKLHELGSNGFYYTQEQIREVIAYAAERGIRVVPEFDVPAHSTSWLVAYPELGSAPGPYTIERRWGIHDPTMNPARESTYGFLDQFFAEMAALFPDEYMHIGGDENNGNHWNANPEIQAFMQAHNIPDNHTLQAYFNQRVLKILTRHHKKMVGWDEIFHSDMPKNIVIHSWRGHEAMNASAKQGYQSILSNGYYIDLIQPAEFHYLNDPIPADSPLPKAEQAQILGGEATSWGELVTWETIDSRIWPRTAAIAERLWSPSSVQDVEDMYRRMEYTSFRLEELGLCHLKNYEMMLRRLTDNQEITALKSFVDVVEPVKIYQRHFQGVTYTSCSPYTRVVDAARPESMTARHFNRLVLDYLANPNASARQELADLLQGWQYNHDAMKHLLKASPVIREIETLSADLARISSISLEALKYLEKGDKAQKSWFQDALEALEAARQPRGQVELMVVDSMEKLIRAAAQIPKE